MDTEKYYRCITDCWRYFQKYSDPVDSDDWWKQLVDEGNKLTKKYKYAEFATDMVMTIQKEIERIQRNENSAKK